MMILAAVTATSAKAQDTTQPSTPSTAVPASPVTQVHPDIRPESGPVADVSQRYRRIDETLQKGSLIPYPTTEDSVLRDYGGWRSKLADYGIGFTMASLNLFIDDVARAAPYRGGTTLYNGQRLIAQTGQLTANMTYDLGRIGLDGGQIYIGASKTYDGDSFRNPPVNLRLREAYWYQPLLGGKVQMEIGIIQNQNNFAGVNVGGTLTGGNLGPSAQIPVEAGQSFGFLGAPTISVEVNWSKSLYSRTALQRSVSPVSTVAEVNANPSGLTFNVARAKALLMHEIGYRRPSRDGQKSMWIRGGILYNNSDYTSFKDGSLRTNAAYYILADRQMSQPDSARPVNGLYVGASFNAARSIVDRIDRYAEGRIYYKGPFPGRARDMASFVIAYNHYSSDFRGTQMAAGLYSASHTISYTGSYSYRLSHGLYLQPGLAVVQNPIYATKTGAAVNALLGVAVFM